MILRSSFKPHYMQAHVIVTLISPSVSGPKNKRACSSLLWILGLAKKIIDLHILANSLHTHFCCSAPVVARVGCLELHVLARALPMLYGAASVA